jgi:hypothetical protein
MAIKKSDPGALTWIIPGYVSDAQLRGWGTTLFSMFDSVFKQPTHPLPSLRALAKQSRATNKNWIASASAKKLRRTGRRKSSSQ